MTNCFNTRLIKFLYTRSCRAGGGAARGCRGRGEVGLVQLWPDVLCEHPASPGPSLAPSSPGKHRVPALPGAGDTLHVNVDVEGFENIPGLTRSSTITGLCLWVPALL